MGNTYKYIEAVLAAFFAAHPQTPRFVMEFEDQMAVISEKNQQWPFVFAAIGSTTENEGITEFSFDLYCWDLLDEARGNVVDVISDTHQILRDLYKYLEQEVDPYITVSQIWNADGLNNGLLDIAAGNVVYGAMLELPSIDPCEIPD